MTLIKSISGIRGTIGGYTGDNLTPVDVVKFACAYGTWIKQVSQTAKPLVIVGRDARPSGDMVQQLVMNSLVSLGIQVIDTGLSTTPTVEMAVLFEKADGGIVITASHNPKQWNALKLLNNKGEFINANDGNHILELAQNEEFEFSDVDHLGQIHKNHTYIDQHIEKILELPLVAVDAIQKAGFKVVVDAVNSTGGIAVPKLLKKLGVACVELYCEPNGNFPHNPEPLKEHLTDLSKYVLNEKADLGITVDPDVDRLAFVSEDGTMFGEEYTLVACADYVLSKKSGNTVSNLSSSSALRDITNKHNGVYKASAVGEVNVVALMKAHHAIIGGEGNGGVIYPELHYGRDALVGIALFLSLLAEKKCTMSALKNSYPDYYMSKNKIQLTPDIDVSEVLNGFKNKYASENPITIDGVKVEFSDYWIHLRKSNTEPIIRIYVEASAQSKADKIAMDTINTLKQIAELKHT